MKIIKQGLLLSLFVGVFFTGCMQNSKQMILENQQSLKVRSYQIKKYDKTKKEVARAIVSTLQDLSFIIDKADMETGTVTATKLVKGASMRMTLIARKQSKISTQVRINAQFSGGGNMPEAVTDPETYKAFFTALDKSLFLESQGI